MQLNTSEGRLHTPGPPTRWSGTPLASSSHAAPQLGEHTEEVLRELGYAEAQICAMRASGACAGPATPTDAPTPGT